MSMPMTCGAGKRDMLSHVLFGANLDFIGRQIEESVINVAREYGARQGGEGVAEALQLLRPREGDSLHRLQIKFFVLLNEDETMRRNLSHVNEKGQTGMLMVCSLCPHKAERFYDALSDELIPAWIKDCRVPHEAFVDSLRQAYLCS
jgi:hypothetical protein